ncbi:thioesterase family protein [Microbacterium sp. No. 7]|uniref:thioesterase family protein n=1 Tax=Microbacterium sp. No. 7 TaxID=1714373 RepID=UPI0006CF21CC|nr:thioesterase family protein [Microbacterium sp. No. 7]ALJ20954.1 thioesterase [Microbacterium sp. No. 7]
MTAYFERLDATRFRATQAVQGAWNTSEQHIAPAFGLIAHVIEGDHVTRHTAPMQLSRISYDILGVLPIDEVAVEVRVLRPGRTIELVEAVLSHDGRPAVIARAWWMQRGDTAALAGSSLPAMPPLDAVEPWLIGTEWRGEFVTTMEIRRELIEPGRARCWVRPRNVLLEGEAVSPTARLLGMADLANGLSLRALPTVAAYPNVDLTAHLLRVPVGEWIGYDTTASFSATGTGITHTVLHDEQGPIATSVQSLTVRPFA